MELWSAKHLETLPIAILIMLVVAIILRKFLINKPLKIRTIPFLVVSAILFILEIFKQVLSGIDGQYDLYHIPLHYCSILIFVPIFAALYTYFGKEEKKNKVLGLATATTSATALLTVIYPCLIYSAGNIENYFKGFFDFHTVTFHNLVIFACILMVALNLHKPNFKQSKCLIFIFMVGFCLLSSSMAQILKTNFANFYVCNIAPLETIRQAVANALGYWPAQIMYILINSSLTISFTIGSYFVYYLFYNIFNNKPNKKED